MEHIYDSSVEEYKVDDISNFETPEDKRKDIEIEDKEEGFIGPRQKQFDVSFIQPTFCGLRCDQ